MNRLKKWFIRGEIFADLCLFLSFISIVWTLPIKDNSVVPLLIFIWLLFSIINDIKDQKKNNI